MNSDDAVIRLEAAGVAFDGRRALEAVTVALDQRRIGVIGSNGSGKSTFARLLNGLVAADSGTVRVHGLDPVRQGKELRRRVGFVFSNPDVQIVMPTVGEDVAFTLRGQGLTREEIAARVTEALDQLGLASLREVSAFTLSGGQKQLLALAAVLVSRPSLVIADEPTALLDAVNSRIISGHLLDDPAHQVVLVTHDLRLAARCDVVLRFSGGRLVEAGEPDAVIDAYEREYA
ncbi:energy-coupling factor ABC transporter ATP-binding protein [Microbacterium sp. RD1]|uniref:energy-coupling factor ABC transporter ATP-binding protein n=1 Tax=Microbacterium sp. RD1 TaxID=3457313 RepID=UPI003FA5DD94